MEKGKVIISIELSPDDYAALRNYAEEQGKSVQDFLVDAIKLEKLLGDLRRDNQKVLVEQDGKLKELQYV